MSNRDLRTWDEYTPEEHDNFFEEQQAEEDTHDRLSEGDYCTCPVCMPEDDDDLS
jgi:hypothetical protein